MPSSQEWYGPDAITTKGGALEISLSEKLTHDKEWEGGMMSSWNKVLLASYDNAFLLTITIIAVLHRFVLTATTLRSD